MNIVSLQLKMKKENGETKVEYVAQYATGDVAGGSTSVNFAMEMMKQFLPTQVNAMEKGLAMQAPSATPAPSTTPTTTPSTGIVSGLLGGLLK